MVKMARDKWAIARLIAISYLVLGGAYTVLWGFGFISPGPGNPVEEFFFYFFLPVWALIGSLFPFGLT